MNRQGVLSQPNMRSMPPGVFTGQQGQQPGRGTNNRLQNGKLAGNPTSTWGPSGFPNVQLGSLQGSGRQLGGVSFAQSVAGSQPAAQLEISSAQDFPSLSNNPQLPNSAQQGLWGAAASRNIGAGTIQRSQPTPLSQSQQQDDMFSSRLPGASQAPFRFGNQPSIGQSSHVGQPPSADEFPPLSRNANGDIGQERASNLMSSIGFSNSQPVSVSSIRTGAGNGLLSALSASNRTPDTRSPSTVGPPGSQRPQDQKSPLDEDMKLKSLSSLREDSSQQQQQQQQQQSLSTGLDAATIQPPETRNPLGAIGNDARNGKSKEGSEKRTLEAQDPLSGMSETDKFSLKGLTSLMNYPDYATLVGGVDLAGLGLELQNPEPITRQIWSLFDDTPPRPAVSKFRLPDCYSVTNVQPIENKISNFNEETLMWIFYSCPMDIKQHWAAAELNSRNWRWHKKLQMWLTKDDVMIPHVLSPNHERGFYIVWDTEHWRKERRELTLYYADLETTPGA